jgi:hypothetical protein
LADSALTARRRCGERACRIPGELQGTRSDPVVIGDGHRIDLPCAELMLKEPK